MTTGTVLEMYGITYICPTKTPAEETPAWISEYPALSTEGIALFSSATGTFSALNMHTTVELVTAKTQEKETI